jgi:hypothetical protein
MTKGWTYADPVHLGHHLSEVWNEGPWRHQLFRAYPVYKLLRIPHTQLARLPNIPTRESDPKNPGLRTHIVSGGAEVVLRTAAEKKKSHIPRLLFLARLPPKCPLKQMTHLLHPSLLP